MDIPAERCLFRGTKCDKCAKGKKGCYFDSLPYAKWKAQGTGKPCTPVLHTSMADQQLIARPLALQGPVSLLHTEESAAAQPPVTELAAQHGQANVVPPARNTGGQPTRAPKARQPVLGPGPAPAPEQTHQPMPDSSSTPERARLHQPAPGPSRALEQALQTVPGPSRVQEADPTPSRAPRMSQLGFEENTEDSANLSDDVLLRIQTLREERKILRDRIAVLHELDRVLEREECQLTGA